MIEQNTPWTESEMIGHTVTGPKMIDIDEGRETTFTKTDSEGRKDVRYYWVGANGEKFTCSSGSIAVCRNMRRGWFGHYKFRSVVTKVLENEESGTVIETPKKLKLARAV